MTLPLLKESLVKLELKGDILIKHTLFINAISSNLGLCFSILFSYIN